MVEGYAISERDYQRIQETIRRVERMADVNFRRRMPVSGWYPEGAGGWPMPDGRVGIYSTTSKYLTRELHQGKWIMMQNISDPIEVILPANPTVGDFYYFMAYNIGGTAKIFSSTTVDQTIIMPSEQWFGTGKYIDLANNGLHNGMNSVTLVCNNANQWIAVDCTVSMVTIGSPTP